MKLITLLDDIRTAEEDRREAAKAMNAATERVASLSARFRRFVESQPPPQGEALNALRGDINRVVAHAVVANDAERPEAERQRARAQHNALLAYIKSSVDADQEVQE